MGVLARYWYGTGIGIFAPYIHVDFRHGDNIPHIQHLSSGGAKILTPRRLHARRVTRALQPPHGHPPERSEIMSREQSRNRRPRERLQD